MDNDWPLVKLGEFIELQTGKPFVSKFYSETQGVKLLRGDNVVQGKFRWANVKFWPKELIANKEREYYLDEGDVILAMDRPWIEAGLKTAQVSKSDLPCLLVQRVARLRTKEGEDQDFLRYVIWSHKFVQYIKLVQTGTAVPHISPKQIKDFEFNKPPEKIRRKIGYIMKTLDEKIHLNRQTNQTLEKMAQALFKSWFVDFDPVIDNALAAGTNISDFPEPLRIKAEKRAELRKTVQQSTDAKKLPEDIRKLFPSEFEESELGWVPKGWENRILYDLAEFINGAAYKKFEPNTKGDGWPIIKIVELKAGVTSKTGFSTVNMPEKYHLVDRDILFSWSGNPETSIDTFIWASGNAWLNQHIFKVVPNYLSSYPFILSLLKHLKPVFTAIARDKQTTGLGHVTVKNFKELQVTMPSNELISKLDEQLFPIYDRIFSNLKASKSLEQTRDFLLPRLISGKMKI